MRVHNTYIHTLLFPPQKGFSGTMTVKALHLTNYNTQLSTNYNASLLLIAILLNLTKKHLQN